MVPECKLMITSFLKTFHTEVEFISTNLTSSFNANLQDASVQTNICKRYIVCNASNAFATYIFFLARHGYAHSALAPLWRLFNRWVWVIRIFIGYLFGKVEATSTHAQEVDQNCVFFNRIKFCQKLLQISIINQNEVLVKLTIASQLVVLHYTCNKCRDHERFRWATWRRWSLILCACIV